MFVQVIVDIKNSNVNKMYYYEIPIQYDGQNLIGYRVEVEFGKRLIQGYVINQVENVDFDTSKIKKIKRIKDDFNVLNQELILLSKELSNKLYCSQIQIIEAMLPNIFKNKYKKYYKLIINCKEIFNLKNYFVNNLIKKDTLEKIITKEEIETLLSKKIIKQISIVEEQLKKSKKKYIILKDEALNEKLTKKQKEVINYLLKYNIAEKKIIKSTLNVGYSVIKKLIDKKIIQEIEINDEKNINKRYYNNDKNLNSEQKKIFNSIKDTIKEKKFSEFLIKGVTGSGKTEIYIQLVNECLKLGKESLILVPEIILTPQTEYKFRQVFGENLAVLHSRLTKKERYIEWKKIRDRKVNICIGTRSAIFAPFNNLSLIIIDEEHEDSYKQQDNPRYNAKDVAKKRAIYNKATLVYASATPSIENYYHFKTKNPKNLLKLEISYSGLRPNVEIELIRNKEEILSQNLICKIKKVIDEGNQVLLFINKRGYTNFIRCFNCGHVYKCKNCDISLNYHKYDKTLQCHFCGYKKRIKDIEKCCSNIDLVSGSYGTQKIEDFIYKEISSAKIIRMDMDTTNRKGMHEKLLLDFRNKKGNILLGTQMISKGLDFPDITLVGILSVDSIISFPSFKSNEKLFQLLTQTAGRTARSRKKSDVIVQTTEYNNIIKYALLNDYEKFYDYEIKRRELINYPPFCKISLIKIKGSVEKKTYIISKIVYNFLYKHYEKDKLLGPTKSTFYKINNEYTMNIFVKYSEESYKKVHSLLNYIKNYFLDLYGKEQIYIIIDDEPLDYI